MFHRLAYLENATVLGDSGEKVTDINLQDPITCLWLELRATNGASYNHNSPMPYCVSSIEIIDGSRVLYSLNGKQAFAMACADLGQWPHTRLSFLGGDPQSLAVPILFGRYLGDPDFAFDPRKFVNPQLRVKWNLAAVNAVGATGYATGTGRLTAMCEVLPSGATPGGMLTKKQHYTWTTAVGSEFVECPTDLPWARIMYRAHLNAYHHYGLISKLRLNCDGGAYVPLDVDTEDLQYWLFARTPRLSYREAGHWKNGDTLYAHLKQVEDVSLNAEDVDDLVAGYINYEYGSQTISVYQAGSAFTSYANIGAHVHGYFPWNYISIPLGDIRDPDSWFQAPDYRSVRMEFVGAVASGEGELCLVQRLSY